MEVLIYGNIFEVFIIYTFILILRQNCIGINNKAIFSKMKD